MITFIAIASPIVVVSTSLSLLVEVLLALYQSPHFVLVEVYHRVKIINQKIVIVAIISRMSYNNIMEVTNMELVRKQTYITPAQDRAVKRLAQQQGTTEAEILRKALDLLLAREGIGENEDPLADLIGLFSGPSQVDHDDIYR
jgi:hypothetical protein